jgi:hypothetical protein
MAALSTPVLAAEPSSGDGRAVAGPTLVAAGTGVARREAARIVDVRGITLAPLTAVWRRRLRIPQSIGGVLVLAVADDSPFDGVDLEPGDVLTAIGRQLLSLPDQATQLLDAAARQGDGTALVLVSRRGEAAVLSVPLLPGRAGSTDGLTH